MTIERDLIEEAVWLLEHRHRDGLPTLSDWLERAKAYLGRPTPSADASLVNNLTIQLVAAEAAKDQQADAKRGKPKTFVGEAVRKARKALDRKALLACAWWVADGDPYASEVQKGCALHQLLQVRRLGWKQAQRLGWFQQEEYAFYPTPLGKAIGAVVARAAKRQSEALRDCVVITWADLLREAERK